MDIQIRTRGAGSGKAGQAMGKGCGTFFFGLFLAAGLFFGWFLAKSVLRSSSAHRWTASRCTIESSEAQVSSSESDSSPYSFVVAYSYEVNGQRFTSGQLSTTGGGYSDFTKVQRRLDRYAAGATVGCWVNPQNHADAVLEQTSHAFALILLFPLVFVVVGGGGILFLWLAKPAGSARGTERIRDNVGETSAAATWVPAIFFAIFLAAGIGVGAFFVGDARHALEARRWPGVPCTVEASHVREHESDSDGHTSYTYSVDILYRYEMGGRSYRSNRWQFVSGSSSGRAAKEAIVEQYPVGREFTCYVNPRDPALAVIERSIGARMFLLLIPAVFTLVGAGGLIGLARARGRERAKARALARDEFVAPGRGIDAEGSPRPGRLPAGVAAARFLPPIPGDGGAITLKPESSPLGRLFGMIFVALFWNGIVSVFLWQVVAGYRSGSMEWGLALFLVPFVLIGLALIWGVFWTFLSLANPRATVKLRSACVPLGGELELAWEMSGRTHVIERLTIHLEGVEHVTYRRGTNTCTETNTFRKIEIVNTDDRREFDQGREKVRIPANAMHSFVAPNNKVTWTLVLNGSIARWPDVDEKFAVVVVPPELLGERSEA